MLTTHKTSVAICNKSTFFGATVLFWKAIPSVVRYFRYFSSVRSNMFNDCKIFALGTENEITWDRNPYLQINDWILKLQDHQRTNLLTIRSIGSPLRTLFSPLSDQIVQTTSLCRWLSHLLPPYMRLIHVLVRGRWAIGDLYEILMNYIDLLLCSMINIANSSNLLNANLKNNNIILFEMNSAKT